MNNPVTERTIELATLFANRVMVSLQTSVHDLPMKDKGTLDPDVVFMHALGIVTGRMLAFWDHRGKSPELTRELLSEIVVDSTELTKKELESCCEK